MRLAGSVNGKTGAHARILEADLALPAYPIRQLVGDLPDPADVFAAAGVDADATNTDPYKRISPREYFERLAGIVVPRDGLVHCPARHEDRIPSCSVGTDREPGVALPRRRRAGRAARSTTSRRCCSAARGDRSCVARRSSARGRTSPMCSAS